LEDAVEAACLARGADVLLVPHVYYLRPDSLAVGLLRGVARGRLAVAAWLHPRATRWTLHALGAADAEAGPLCFDLRDYAAAADCAEDILKAAPPGTRSAGARRDLSDPEPERWYPVLDYSRCVSCGQCMDFCLFGTYTREADRVVASSPDNCKPGCPACARVCPVGAIMFPHYADDPAIAGALPDEGPAAGAGDASHGGRSDRAAAADARTAAADRGDLEDLMRALDEFDD